MSLEIKFANKPEDMKLFWDTMGVGQSARDRWLEMKESGKVAVALAFVDNQPAGWGSIYFSGVPKRNRRVIEVINKNFPDETKKIPFLAELLVFKEFRNMGVGTKITDAREKLIMDRFDVSHGAVITVKADNKRSLNLHRKLGYKDLKDGDQSVYKISIPSFDSTGKYTPFRERTYVLYKDLQNL